MRCMYMLAPLHIADLPDDLAAVRSIALEQHQIARQLVSVQARHLAGHDFGRRI
jgi:hypothetical protein